MENEKKEFWTITEIQELPDGTEVSQSFVRTDERNAWSTWHASLASGYIGAAPYHAAYLISSLRGIITSKILDFRGDDT